MQVLMLYWREYKTGRARVSANGREARKDEKAGKAHYRAGYCLMIL